MPKFSSVAVAVLFLIGVQGGTAGLAEAETTEPYIPYTAYSKDGFTTADYGDKVIVVFHGFLSAMPNGFYKAFQKKMKDDFTVLGYTYDWFDTARTIAAFDAFHEAHLKGKTLIYAGSSLGGFWADFFGARHGVDGIMLSNPILDPYKSRGIFIGEHFSEKREIPVTVGEAEVAAYQGLALNPAAAVPRLIVLTHDDTHSVPTRSFDAFKDNPESTVAMLSTGGHSLNYRKHFVWGLVEAWLRR
jgi:predicted esterase YcpF (UPF0227 family)